jgi:hypothetical protein
VKNALRWNTDAYGDGTANPFGAATPDARLVSIHANGG